MAHAIWRALVLCATLLVAPQALSATLLPPGENCFFSDNGDPLAAGTVQFYIPTTSTPKDTWMDSGQSVLNTNPVLLDSAGCAVIFGSGAYRELLKDSLGNTRWDRLTYSTDSAAGTSWGGTSAGSANAQTITTSSFSSADGQSIAFVAGFTNTGALTVTPSNSGPIAVLKDLATGSAALTGGEVVAGNVVLATYVITTGSFHLVAYPEVAFNNLALGTTTPSALAGNTNNLALPSTIVDRLTSTGSVNITGIVAPTVNAAGYLLVLQNVDTTDTITLTANDTASTAANRFLLTFPLALAPGQQQALLYDATSAGWRPYDRVTSQPIAGEFKNLVVTASSATNVVITADALTLEDTSGTAMRVRNVSITGTTCAITNSGANGLDSGAEASNTWYSVWIINSPIAGGTTACLLSTSATAPTMPANYTFRSRVGWVRNDGSSNFWRTLQYGRRAQITIGTNPTVAPQMITGISGSTTVPTWTAQAWSSFAPPTASELVFIAFAVDASFDVQVMVAPNNSYGAYTSTTNPPPIVITNDSAASPSGGSITSSFVLESANVFYASSGANGRLSALGWVDNQ